MKCSVSEPVCVSLQETIVHISLQVCMQVHQASNLKLTWQSVYTMEMGKRCTLQLPPAITLPHFTPSEDPVINICEHTSDALNPLSVTWIKTYFSMNTHYKIKDKIYIHM